MCACVGVAPAVALAVAQARTTTQITKPLTIRILKFEQTIRFTKILNFSTINISVDLRR